MDSHRIGLRRTKIFVKKMIENDMNLSSESSIFLFIFTEIYINCIECQRISYKNSINSVFYRSEILDEKLVAIINYSRHLEV